MSEQSRRIQKEQRDIKRQKEWVQREADRIVKFCEREYDRGMDFQVYEELKSLADKLRTCYFH